MTWTCLLGGPILDGVGEGEQILEERFNRGGKGNDSCKHLGAGKGEFFKRHRKNWCGVQRALQTHRVSLPVCQEVAFLFGICKALLTTSSYIPWYQFLHMKGNWDHFTVSESCSIALASALRLCLADPPCYEILPCQHCHSPGPVPFLPQSPSLWLGLCCSWRMSSPLNHIWSNHHPFVIQPIR